MEVKLVLDQTAEGEEDLTNIYCIVLYREPNYCSNSDLKEQFVS